MLSTLQSYNAATTVLPTTTAATTMTADKEVDEDEQTAHKESYHHSKLQTTDDTLTTMSIDSCCYSRTKKYTPKQNENVNKHNQQQQHYYATDNSNYNATSRIIQPKITSRSKITKKNTLLLFNNLANPITLTTNTNNTTTPSTIGHVITIDSPNNNSCNKINSSKSKRKAISCIEKEEIKTPRLKMVCRSELEASAYTPLPLLKPNNRHEQQKEKNHFAALNEACFNQARDTDYSYYNCDNHNTIDVHHIVNADCFKNTCVNSSTAINTPISENANHAIEFGNDTNNKFHHESLDTLKSPSLLKSSRINHGIQINHLLETHLNNQNTNNTKNGAFSNLHQPNVVHYPSQQQTTIMPNDTRSMPKPHLNLLPKSVFVGNVNHTSNSSAFHYASACQINKNIIVGDKKYNYHNHVHYTDMNIKSTIHPSQHQDQQHRQVEQVAMDEKYILIMKTFHQIEWEFMQIEGIDNTEKRAFSMVKWALMTNESLRQDYAVQTLLGWGGCGAVLSAIRRSDHMKVAIKIIYKRIKANSDKSKSSESNLLSQLDHPFIVQHVDHFEDLLAYYLVMENFGMSWRKSNDPEQPHPQVPHLIIDPFPCQQCEAHQRKRPSALRTLHRVCPVDDRVVLFVGQASCSSLYDFIEYHNGRIPRYLVKRLFRQIAESIVYLHSNAVVHGDIKEENILIGYPSNSDDLKYKEQFFASSYHHHSNGRKSKPPAYTKARSCSIPEEKLIAKICDFGHAIKLKRNIKRLVRYGTRELTAPELYPNLRKNKPVCHYEQQDHHQQQKYNQEQQIKFLGYAQDIWALAFLLYTMLNGNLPDSIGDYINGKKHFDTMSFPLPHTNLIEEDCLDLLERMLMIDPEQRINIFSILEHPWLQVKT